MSIRFFTITAIALLLIPSLIQAEGFNEKNTLRTDGTYLNISATERVNVQKDLLIASMRVEKEGSNAESVQNIINITMSKVSELAKKTKDITLSTEQYYIYQYNPAFSIEGENQKKKEAIWRGGQGLRLESTSATTLLKLVGQLQNMGLLMQDLQYVLSTEKMEETRDLMLEKTVEKLMKRAQRVASVLGKQEVELVEINVDSSNIQPYSRPIMAISSAEMSTNKMVAPTAEAGISEIIMTISAKVLLKN